MKSMLTMLAAGTCAGAFIALAAPVQAADMSLTRLDRLEEQANHLRVPVAYASQLYMLRNHIDLVREGLRKHTEKPAQ